MKFLFLRLRYDGVTSTIEKLLRIDGIIENDEIVVGIDCIGCRKYCYIENKKIWEKKGKKEKHECLERIKKEIYF